MQSCSAGKPLKLLAMAPVRKKRKVTRAMFRRLRRRRRTRPSRAIFRKWTLSSGVCAAFVWIGSIRIDKEGERERESQCGGRCFSQRDTVWNMSVRVET